MSVFFFCSCRTRSVEDFYSEDLMHIALNKSQGHISRIEQQLIDYSLEHKALYLVKILFEGLHSDVKLVPKIFIEGKAGVLRLDMSALLLGALASKYCVLRQSEDKKLISTLIDNIDTADLINGYNGLLPNKIEVINGNMMAVGSETNANVYVQQFYAYYQVLRYVDDQKIQRQLRRHLRLVLWHFVKNNYVHL